MPSALRPQRDEPSPYHPGQRWACDPRPELGLGLVMAVDRRTVRVFFPAAAETLSFAAETSPLRRVVFAVGDQVRHGDGASMEVAEVQEAGGTVCYRGHGGEEWPESVLADDLGGRRPGARLIAGEADEARLWHLRQDCLKARAEHARREVRGLVGARVTPLPHQLAIAAELGDRAAPRALLADEVGLGKTIEAALVLHRLIKAGRVSRALVLVPESLVHQWFVELLRRFELHFAIYDAARVEAEAASAPQGNAFLSEQLVLVGTNWLAADPGAGKLAVEAGWDLVIVDEVHHLQWSEDAGGDRGYRFVEALAAEVQGLLLLSATPEQLGLEGHFARLRLLDPARYRNYGEFVEEAEGYRALSELAERVVDEDLPLSEDDGAELGRLLGEGMDFAEEERAAIISKLIDLHGTGRVMFRNRRAVLGGFPDRKLALVRLDEGREDGGGEGELGAKVRWFHRLLRESAASAKFLVIGSTRALAEGFREKLAEVTSASVVVFHEGLSLVERDRQAAWFADPEGARVLVCSEIGSEGRNFQFTQNLVMLDLPKRPGLLEQRIGRLDRIGQEGDVQIYVPVVAGSGEEVWADWYDKGLGAFTSPLEGASLIDREFRARVESAAAGGGSLNGLIEEGRAFCAEVAERLEKGRDRLLDLAAFDRPEGERLRLEIEKLDSDPVELCSLMDRLFEQFGVSADALGGEGVAVIKPDHLFDAGAFPAIREGGMTVTTDRATALGREDSSFLTWDHPLVEGAIDALVSSDLGSAGWFCGELDTGGEGLYVEAVFILEVTAPARLAASRFFPAQPISVMVNSTGRKLDDELADEVRRGAVGADPAGLERIAGALEQVLPEVIGRAESAVDSAAREVAAGAVAAMEAELGGEVERFRALMKIGRNADSRIVGELAALEEERGALRLALAEPSVRLDAVRLIQVG